MNPTTPPAARPSGLRLAARLARRETGRRPGRSLLVALPVAVPVAGMAVAAVWVRTDHRSGSERWRDQWGNAELVATPGAPHGGTPEPGARFAELVPDGTRTVSFRADYNRVLRTTGGARSAAEITDLPMTDSLAAPIMQVTSGRGPVAAGEVFLTRAVAGELGVGVGDVLALERPRPARWTVVGVGERRDWWGAETVVLGRGTPFAWRDAATGQSVRTVLADLPGAVTTEELLALSRSTDGVGFAPGMAPEGVPGPTSWSMADADGTSAVAWSWVVGTVVLTVVGIVIAAAFAAGARRQLVTLGQLAANGADPAVLRRVLFLQGTWTGLAGVVLGAGLAVVVLAGLYPHADAVLGHDVDPYAVRPWDMVPIAILGIAAATTAALVPARTTAKVPVLAALAGRRPLRPVPAWLTAAGLAVGGAGLGLLALAVLGANGATDGGTVWVLTAIVGGVAVLLGACAVAPGYVSVLEPLAARLGGASRLAARSLARQRTRTGAVVSGVCATAALAVGASALLLSADAADSTRPDWIRSDEVQLLAFERTLADAEEAFGASETPAPAPDALLAEVRAALPGSEVHQVVTAMVPGSPGHARWEVRELVPDDGPPRADIFGGFMVGPFPQFATIADATFLELYDLSGDARRALAADGMVALGFGELAGMATATVTVVAERLPVPDAGASPPGTVLAPPVVELLEPLAVRVVPGDGLALGSVAPMIVTPERAARLGLELTAGLTVVRAPESLSGDQRANVQDAIEDQRDASSDGVRAGDTVVSVYEQMLRPAAGVDSRTLDAALTAAAFVLSLFVVGVSLALAAAETRDERDILAVVGAPPPVMRRTSGRKALFLTLLGAALAVPVGFLPVAVFIAAGDADLPLVFPWRVVVLLVAAVPLLAAVLTTAASGLALRARPVRVSTMAFD